METIKATSNQVLEIDLTTRTHRVIPITMKDRQHYLGAKGLGLKLIHDRMTPGKDPLGPDNIIALMPGVLMGTGGPSSGRFAAVSKSPLTGIMLSSSCGGPFGMALKTAGWDGLLIKGKASAPVYLDIFKEGVRFKDARTLWGLGIPETQAFLDDKKTKSLVIGPAGENLVRYANVASGHRFLGRGGLGAVMGSKNLKAVRATGGACRIKPFHPNQFKLLKQQFNTRIKTNIITGDKYHRFGTSANLNICLEAGIVPVRNFQTGWDEKASTVTGEYIAGHYDTAHHACKPCSIRCGHKGRFKSGNMAVPEYETIVLLGTNLGIFDIEEIARFNQVCAKLGLDTISAGATLAWVMEAAAKGLVNSDLKFGSIKGIIDTLEDIAVLNGLGAKMALGTRALSEEFGGRSFAMHVKGMELSGYDPRGSFGHGLAYSVANRGGCHLSAYMVALDVYFKLLKPDVIYGKATWTKFFEDLTCCVNSLQICYFTVYAAILETILFKYTPDFLLRAATHFLPKIAVRLVDFSIYTKLYNAVTGTSLTNTRFLEAGERIHVLERYMNSREGITHKDDTLPDRLLNEGRASDPQEKKVPIRHMLPKYYRIRGYDSQGIPTPETLKRLDIS